MDDDITQMNLGCALLSSQPAQLNGEEPQVRCSHSNRRSWDM
jgi:hypothetical protein